MAALAFRDIDRTAAHRICGAIKLGNVPGAKPRDALIGRHAGGQEFDVGDKGLQFRRIAGMARPFMLRVMQELTRSSMVISAPARALYFGKSP